MFIKNEIKSFEGLTCNKSNDIKLVCYSPECSKNSFSCINSDCSCFRDHLHCYKISFLQWITDEKRNFQQRKKQGKSLKNQVKLEQAQIEQFSIYSDLNIKCKGSKKISRICCSRECQYPSLHCSTKQCLCQKNHKFCFQIELERWNHFLKDKADEARKSLSTFIELQKQVLIKLDSIKNQLNQMINFGWMESKHAELAKQIYLKKNRSYLTGKMANQFWEVIKNQSKKHRIDESLQRFISDEFYEESNRIMTQFLKLISDSMNILIKSQAKMLNCSKIAEKKEDYQILNSWLKSPTKVELIFRASEHGFSAAKFHKICDNIDNTLIIAKTEFGKRIGGYTPLKWNSAKSNSSNDLSGQSFIFSLDIRQKMDLTQPQFAIYCNSQFGPTFGGGYDIFLSNECNKNNCSFTNFPHSYNYYSQYKQGQSSYTVFCGARQGFNFKVLEYEVFKVSWQ